MKIKKKTFENWWIKTGRIYPRIIPDFFWIFSGLYKDYSWIASGLFLHYPRITPGLSFEYPWNIPKLPPGSLQDLL